MTTEQPYFTIQVDRCEKCPYEHVPAVWNVAYSCRLANDADEFETHKENRNGIGPTCPMWGQRVAQDKPSNQGNAQADAQCIGDWKRPHRDNDHGEEGFGLPFKNRAIGNPPAIDQRATLPGAGGDRPRMHEVNKPEISTGPLITGFCAANHQRTE